MCIRDRDSAAVAGLMDLLRCQGCWYLSARYGFLFGSTRPTLDYEVPDVAAFEGLAACFAGWDPRVMCFSPFSRERLFS